MCTSVTISIQYYICMCTALIIIIMYIYNALINALSAHMIHINLNMIFYTHSTQSYQNNLHKVLFKEVTLTAGLPVSTALLNDDLSPCFVRVDEQALKTHLFKSVYNTPTPPLPHLCVCVCVCVCVSTHAHTHVCVHVCVQYPAVHFCICSRSTCIIDVYSNQSLVMFGYWQLWFIYWNCCM